MTFSELRQQVMWIGSSGGYIYNEEAVQMRDAPAVPLKELASEAEQGNRVSEWMNPRREESPQTATGLSGLMDALGSIGSSGIGQAIEERERRYRQEYEYRNRMMERQQQAVYQQLGRHF